MSDFKEASYPKFTLCKSLKSISTATFGNADMPLYIVGNLLGEVQIFLNPALQQKAWRTIKLACSIACLKVTEENDLIVLCHDGQLSLYNLNDFKDKYLEAVQQIQQPDVFEVDDPLVMLNEFDIDLESQYDLNLKDDKPTFQINIQEDHFAEKEGRAFKVAHSDQLI